MKHFLALGVAATFFVGACSNGAGLQPQTTLVATDLKRQAKTETAPGSIKETDPFVHQLNEAQKRYETDFLKVPSGSGVVQSGAVGDAMTTYVQGRLTQVNDLCKIYFDGLFEVAQTQNFVTNEIALLANVAQGALGLAGAAAETLAFLALGETTVLGSFENYQEIYFLAPSPQLTFTLVRQAQAKFIEDQKPNLVDLKSYPVARDIVRQYAGLCTPPEIRRLIDAAVASEKLEINRENRNRLEQIANSAVAATLENSSKLTGLTDENVADLFVASGKSGGNPAQIDAAKKRLSGANINYDPTELQRLGAELEVLNRYGVIGDITQLAEQRETLAATPKPAATDGQASNPVTGYPVPVIVRSAKQ